MVINLLINIPLLVDTDPGNILKFLIILNGVYDLVLVTDFEFISLLVSRTSGRITQILVAYLGTTQNSGSVRSAIISTFRPPHVKERFVASHVLALCPRPAGEPRHLNKLNKLACRARPAEHFFRYNSYVGARTAMLFRLEVSAIYR
jgi:hypothetical protein